MTFRPDTLARSLISCSASPSEKYSWSLAGLMSAKGSTAMDVLFNEEAFAALLPGRKYAPIAATATNASTGVIASFHSVRLPGEFSTFKGVPSALTVSPFACSSVGSDVAEAPGSIPLSSATRAINRYPRLGKVSINSGLSGRSPKAFRISRMYFLRTSGLT